MAHGRGRKPPTSKGPRVPNNKGCVGYGHHQSASGNTERHAASPNNRPRQHRKISKGFGLNMPAVDETATQEVAR